MHPMIEEQLAAAWQMVTASNERLQARVKDLETEAAQLRAMIDRDPCRTVAAAPIQSDGDGDGVPCP